MQDAALEKKVRESGILSADHLRIALAVSRKSNISLEEVLLSHGFVSQGWLRDLHGRASKIKTVSLMNFIPDESAVSRLPVAIARRHCVLPISVDQDKQCLCVAMVQAGDIVAMDELRAAIPAKWDLDIRIAIRHEILAALDQCYGVELSINGILAELDKDALDAANANSANTISTATDYTQPIVRLIDALLVDAVRRKASDIHLEPEQHYLCIRFRIDGVLQQVRSLHLSYWPAMLVRLKVICGLNIAETRCPQDGHLSLMLEARDIDFRISTFPTLHGENVVLRLLDRHTTLKPLSQLGLSETQRDCIAEKISYSQGLIVVAGPTGSGKTTTLYSMLNLMQSDQRNIMTLEDPVEYLLPSIRQCAVGEAVKLDFPSGVRGLLRQDPDVILVGETRDQETCSTVLRAALTGHLVLTTLHSSSVLTALYRLQDLGARLGQLSEVLLLIIAQRLVRKLCPVCRQSQEVPDEFKSRLPGTQHIFQPQGCSHCQGSGFRDRQVIIELLNPDVTLRHALAAEDQQSAIAKCSESDFKSLEKVGLDLVRCGVTSLCEVRRVVNFNVQYSSISSDA